jgi:hypothetical protein
MSTYLLTVNRDDFNCGEFMPPIRLKRFQQDPIFHRLAPGRRIQLRRPDGQRQSSILEKIAVDGLVREAYSTADEATFYSFPADPIIRLWFRPGITETIAPPGTEIWLVD